MSGGAVYLDQTENFKQKFATNPSMSQFNVSFKL